MVTVTSSLSSTSTGTALQAPIPVAVAQAALDTPGIPTVAAETTGGSSMDLPSTTSASQVDRRPTLRLADVAYAVRMAWVGQADRIVDTLRPRDQLLLIVHT